MNESKGQLLAQRVTVASSLWARGKGLLGTASLAENEGLWITPCRSIHTFFMRYPIDVLFLDGQGVVVARSTYPAWRVSGWYRTAAGVLELPAGTLERTRTEVGDKVTLKTH